MQPARSDFQGTAGVDIFNQFVKLGDALALSILLLEIGKIRTKKSNQQPLEIYDIGGADGAMMLALLQVLNITAKITLCERQGTRIGSYEEKLTTHAKFFKSVTAVDRDFGHIDFKLSDQQELILASHIFYYNRNMWLTCSSIQNHLFTKIFRSLQEGGVFSVVLQSSALEHDGSHELWEDHIYPVLENVKHSENNYYANAEEFDAALSAYRKQFISENGSAPDWKISTSIAKSVVPIGKLNTQVDESGKYPQSAEVLAILQFYLKGHDYNALEAEKQKQVLDILMKHFSKEECCEMVHYNKVYAIEIGPVLLSTLNQLEHNRGVNVKRSQSPT